MGKLEVLEVDRKQIDGVPASFDHRIVDAGKPTAVSVSSLTTAKVMGGELRARVRKPADTANACPDFKATRSTLTSDLKNEMVAGKKSPFGIHSLNERTHLDAEPKPVHNDAAVQPGARARAATRGSRIVCTRWRT
ncbi:MAG: hypothetical protein KGL52_15585 [Rhodospirillales bacterium]|nr:hypothetical protein [Rhodospirillales bacterium]